MQRTSIILALLLMLSSMNWATSLTVASAFAVGDAVLVARSSSAAHALTWEGRGISVCWLGKAFGKRDDVADLMFTSKSVTLPGFSDLTLPGLGLTIVRYNAVASICRVFNGQRMERPATTQIHQQIDALCLDGLPPNQFALGYRDGDAPLNDPALQPAIEPVPGEPLPVVTFDAAKQTAEVRWPDQLDTLQFTGGEQSSASFTVHRNDTQLSTL